MDVNEQFRRNVRIFYAWIGSIVALGAAPIIAGHLVDRETTFWRAAGVAVGTLGFVPWMWLMFAIVRRSDEFVRRIHLIAIAIASAFGLLLLITLGWLVRASFIDPPDFTAVWVAWLVGWILALAGTNRYYERPR